MFLKKRIPREKTGIVLILRGHIRDGFNDSYMYQFVKYLQTNYNLKLYIHTWSQMNGKHSWKNYDNNFIHKENLTQVTDQIIRKYFKDIQIETIIIEDEKDNEIIGSIDGFICKSRCPKIAWKNMWYGKYSLYKQIENIVDSKMFTIDTRFDLFTYSNSCHGFFNNQNILKKIEEVNYDKNNIHFLSNKFIPGIDNIIFGQFTLLYSIVKIFHFQLDSIIQQYSSVTHQEFLVPLICKHLKSKDLRDKPMLNERKMLLKKIEFLV